MMKKVKSYSGVWAVEKVLYAIEDFNLPFPITFHQMALFVLSLIFLWIFGDVFPLSLIDNFLIKYIGIPVFLTWFLEQKRFDGKNPYNFLKSYIGYKLRNKKTVRYKNLKKRNKVKFDTVFTVGEKI